MSPRQCIDAIGDTLRLLVMIIRSAALAGRA